MSWKIYHNPKCSKSRKALEILNENSISPDIIEYLKRPLSAEELKNVFQVLGKKPNEVLRKKEEEFKVLSIDLNDDDQVIDAIIKSPKILERPIIINGQRGVIGRPPENIMELL